MVDELRLTLLGSGQIHLGAAPLTQLALAKAQALLFYLAVTGRPAARSEMTELLWGELAPDDARRNLRVALTKLRQAVGGHLHITRTSVAFNKTAPYWLDVDDFIQFIQQAPMGAHPGAPLPPQQVSALEAALALYQGEFLQGFGVANAPAFEEWAIVERERLHQIALQSGETLVDHYLATQTYTAGIDLSRRLLTWAPWHETLHRKLMMQLAATGQRGAALQQYESCRRILGEELGVEPEPATAALYEELRNVAYDINVSTASVQPPRQSEIPNPEPPITPPPHNLPAPTTSFLGRDAELAQIGALIADPTCRLLTLLGPGGIGKSRLALQAAYGHAAPKSRFVDGVFFVSLAAATQLDEAIPLIAAAVGCAFSGRRAPRSELLQHVQGRALLLVLDNCEHLVDEATFFAEMLAAAPQLMVLVTSRARLRLYEESIFDVRALSVPPAEVHKAAELIASSAVQLFVERARRVNLAFDFMAEAEAVAAICRLVEGVPLGIELAAGWVRSHTCAAIAEAIRQGIDFLASQVQNTPPRHRSLRAAFDHSWRLLDQADAALFNRLVVFRGGFDAQAAQAVVDASPTALMRLTDKSLVQRQPDGRYSVHELLRQYGETKLKTGERASTQADHARYYAALAAQEQPFRESETEMAAIARLRADFDNIRAGWQWVIGQIHPIGGPAPAGPATDPSALAILAQSYAPMLAYFLLRECRYEEGRQLLAAAEAAMVCARWDGVAAPSQAQTTLAQLRSLLADLLFYLSQFTEIERLIEKALPPLRAAGQTVEVAEALARLGRAYLRMGRYDEAETVLQQSIEHYRAAGEEKRITLALNALGIVHSNQGRFAVARGYYEQCLAIFRRAGYQRGIANLLSNLGSNYGRAGDYAESLPLYQETYQIALRIGDRLTTAIALSNLGSVSRSLGRHDQALRYYEESVDLCRAIGERRWTAASLNGLALSWLEQGRLAAAYDHAREALTIAAAIDSAPDVMDSLSLLGQVLAAQGEIERAYTILHFVDTQPVTQFSARQRCHQSRAALEPRLAPAAVVRLRQRAQRMTLAELEI